MTLIEHRFAFRYENLLMDTQVNFFASLKIWYILGTDFKNVASGYKENKISISLNLEYTVFCK